MGKRHGRRKQILEPQSQLFQEWLVTYDRLDWQVIKVLRARLYSGVVVLFLGGWLNDYGRKGGVEMVRHVALLGFYVGEQYFEEYTQGDKFPQIAAFKLEGRLLQAMKSTGVQVSTVASVAVSTYPRIKRVWFPGRNIEGGVVLPLINLPVIKMASRFVGSLIGLCMKGRAADALFIYAAHSPNLIAGYIYSKMFNKPYFVYIPDLPLFMDVALKRGRVTRWLKKVDSALLDKLLCAASGLVVVSRPMVEDSEAWQHQPYLVVEGVADGAPIARSNEASVRPYILYAGGVNQAYGLVELIEGYLQSGIDYDLILCGRGDLEDYLAEVVQREPSIKYLGFVSPERVAELQSHAACLALTRNPAEAYTRYSFPSKLLEYMTAGIPILSTRLKGIPNEYFEYVNVIESFSVQAVADAFSKFCQESKADLSARAERGRLWALEVKSEQAVGKRVIEFMEKCK